MAEEWLDRSMEIMRGGMEPTGSTEWLFPDAVSGYSGAAKTILEGGKKIQGAQMPKRDVCEVSADMASGTRALIFTSLSLPQATLDNYMEQAKQPGVVLLFRGVKEGGTLTEFYMAFSDYVAEGETHPNVALDPTLFKRFGVDVVPTIIALRDGESVARATGDVSVDWVLTKAGESETDRGEEQDLGQVGEVYEVAEPDLIEEMQRRVLAVDWDAKKAAALARFWDRKALLELPRVEETQTREWQAQFVVASDIVDNDGNVLIEKGHRYSPFEYVPLSKTIFIFDARDEEQLRLVAGLAATVREEGRGVVLITTALERQNGWKKFAALEKQLRAPLYVLTGQLAETLDIKAVPTVVRGEGARIFITELAMPGNTDG